MVLCYEHYNAVYPITIRGTTGIGLFFVGDYCAQKISARQDTIRKGSMKDFAWDSERALRSCTWRAVIWAPVAHYFWVGLENFVTPAVAHLGARGTALKVLLDFVTVSPPLVMSFLVWSKFFETWDSRKTWEHSRDKFPSAYLAACCFWTPIHMATYSNIIPLRHRLVWVSMCSVGYGCLISWVNAGGIQS